MVFPIGSPNGLGFLNKTRWQREPVAPKTLVSNFQNRQKHLHASLDSGQEEKDRQLPRTTQFTICHIKHRVTIVGVL